MFDISDGCLSPLQTRPIPAENNSGVCLSRSVVRSARASPSSRSRLPPRRRTTRYATPRRPPPQATAPPPCRARSTTRSTGRAPATRSWSRPAPTPSQIPLDADGDRPPRRRGPGAAAADRRRQPPGDLFTFVDGGTLRHLSLRGTTPAQDTLVMDGGLGEDLEITSVAGDGAKVLTDDHHDGAARQRRDRRGHGSGARRAEAARGRPRPGRSPCATSPRSPRRERDPLRGPPASRPRSST